MHHPAPGPALGELSGFRREFHRCLTRRADGLFELADAVLCADGRLVLAVDVSPWLRPDGNTCTDRSFCHTYGRGRNERYPAVWLELPRGLAAGALRGSMV